MLHAKVVMEIVQVAVHLVIAVKHHLQMDNVYAPKINFLILLFLNVKVK